MLSLLALAIGNNLYCCCCYGHDNILMEELEECKPHFVPPVEFKFCFASLITTEGKLLVISSNDNSI